ncbi:Acetylornithine deacetylase [Lentibacillus sp. JNUCC-1]|uniref:M20/M25/M40 family metallo-hydrolase n=1 Tax=Lentibacillus sp. JNUCC-1 TaxID=2654513 RepID=UPI0012E97FC8|nr:M20/M25/M40 family metallo-hydrolase [Lentibacillus sp. JNUCC-1]MUV39132.1 Acetylornithine deacetylase [Lentibacillus sp. JNUCC-1]
MTKRLVTIESIVNTEGEKVIAHTLHTIISSLPYFKENPDHVLLEQTTNDDYERYNVLAFVKGTKTRSNRTVVLMGHMDTVGTDDFNRQQELATDPDAWMNALKGDDYLSDSVQEQLASGDWLFGRGVLDMKSGLASNLHLLSYYAEHPEELEGNLVLLSECDEEDSSHGVLSAADTLLRWQQEHGFHYAAAINSDFVAPQYDGDDHRYVYKGTIGKLLPSFLITGEETHVGSCFGGLDPNFIAAELTRQISYNPNLCDRAQGEMTVPPVSLKQMDLKPSYSVQTALSALVYYNFFTHSWSPQKVLEILKKEAETAFQNALQTFEERYRAYCDASGQPYQDIPWEPRVFLYEEMEHMLIEAHGQAFIDHMNAFKQDLMYDDTLDIRMFAARVAEEAWTWMEDKSPAIFLFYSTLYSPRVELKGESEDERRLLKALDESVEAVQPHYEHPITVRNFFPHISDMSFLAISDTEDEIKAVSANNPAWGTKHKVDYEKIRQLNIPVLNIGPYGMDGHKKMERMEMTYSFEILPNLTNKVIQKVLGKV